MKKLLSLLLIFSMILSMSTFVYADDSISGDLEKTIKAVKSKIEIPAELDVFNSNYNAGGRNLWNLEWNKKGDYSKGISISCDSEGNIFSFNKRNAYDNSVIENIMSDEEATKIASDFFSMANPLYYPNFKIDSNARSSFRPYIQSNGGTKTVSFQEYRNDIKVKDSFAFVNIYEKTKEIYSFSINLSYIDTKEFAKPEKFIDKAAAKAAFIDKIGINLQYMIYSDYQKEKVSTFPVYQVDERSAYIDAITGEKLELDYYFGRGEGGQFLYNDAKSTNAGAPKEEIKLSEVEIAKVSELQKLISKEEAQKIAKDFCGQSLDGFNLSYINLNKSHFDGYSWSLNYEKTTKTDKDTKYEDKYFNIDAVNKIIRNYSSSAGKELDKTKKIDAAKAKEIADKVMNTYAPNYVPNLKFNENDSKPDDYGFNINFDRMYNGIPVKGQGMNFRLTNDGTITYYSLNFYDSIEFKALNNKVSDLGKVFDALDKEANFEMSYKIKTDFDEQGKRKEKVILVYSFNKSMPMLNPETLEMLDYKGEVYKPKKTPEYNDLNGHWAESIIKILSYNGVYITEEGSFNPEKIMTRGEFYIVLASIMGGGYNIYMYDEMSAYKYLTENGVVEEIPDYVTDKDKQIDRKTAAKYIVYALGYKKLVKNPDLFVNPYSDTVEGEYKACAVLLNILNIMKGDSENKFNADKSITRAEAATIIYNLLKNVREQQGI